jgi:uncharacterized DUF497 family protein
VGHPPSSYRDSWITAQNLPSFRTLLRYRQTTEGKLENELRFEWDPRKAARNRAKHGVSFEEASSVFGDPLGWIVDDPRHSRGERRHALLGSSERHRVLTVMFTEREEVIRVISARKATRQERKNYEEQQS